MSTIIVTLCDLAYWNKAKRTIIDIRSAGRWEGELMLIAVGEDNSFVPNENFCYFYGVDVIKFPLIDKSKLLKSIQEHPFTQTDGRELNKTTQWEKLHIFDTFFKKWDKVFFIDAGLRIFDNVKYFLEIDWEGKFLANDDGCFDGPKRVFGPQIEQIGNPEVLEKLKKDFGEDYYEKPYFLNGLFIYDTKLLNLFSKKEMIETMNLYPVSRNNEMGIMNLIIGIKNNLWTPLPKKASNGKYLFDWSDANYSKIPGITWRDFCSLKYPISINFECE